jgi:hypothetical protein
MQAPESRRRKSQPAPDCLLPSMVHKHNAAPTNGCFSVPPSSDTIPPLITPIVTTMSPVTPARPSGAPTVDTTTLAFTVGCAAAVTTIPAVAVIVYIHVRQYRRRRRMAYSSLAEHDDSSSSSSSSTLSRHRRDPDHPEHGYREAIQLRDYENEREGYPEQHHMAS